MSLNRINYQSLIADKRGSALIITLLLITILTGLVVDFVYEVYIDTAALSNWGNAQRASLLARSGQAISTEVIAEVKNDTYTDTREVELPLPQKFGPNINLFIKIEDENARFNVNSIILPNGLTDDKAFPSLKKLLEYLKINPDIALFIADWIDPDSEPRIFGSEDVAKNDFLWSIDELKMIEGIDKENFNKIIPYVTVYGNNLVNVNTTPLPVLMSLHPDMTESLAQSMVDYRESAPFESIGAVGNVSGLESISIDIQPKITVKASNFRVTAQASVNEITRMIESIVDTSMKIHFWREG
jgi:general secretion pathway protein K